MMILAFAVHGLQTFTKSMVKHLSLKFIKKKLIFMLDALSMGKNLRPRIFLVKSTLKMRLYPIGM